MNDAHDVVRIRAYQLWENAGRPEGRDVEFWLMAERLIAIDETADSGPVSEIDTIHRTLETPPKAGISPQADPKGGSQTAPTPSDLVDQKARDRSLT
ncbi:DUF2934 domain-containing protein [Starkeya sp. ORNL1]|uniref:DUF2934 domain-containing protein n=1 Tax=Starkeya sp. ORNL1 TaxID=2709380 RepID=UPI001462B9A3|nr:DUF2934 domain-containing protein [Starkeya sp. ORNL1]QJP12983.1 DUF2934 domain-containing protein [Starkeya sp. ORNL1]